MNGIYEKSKFLHCILNTTDLDKNLIYENAKKSDIQLPDGGYLVAVIRINAVDGTSSDSTDMSRITLIDLLCRSFANSNHFFIPDVLSTPNLPIIVFENESDGIFGAFTDITNLKNEFFKETGFNFSFGLSSLKAELSDIKIAYAEAKKDLDKTSAFNNSASESIFVPVSKTLIQDICIAVGQLNIHKTEALISDFFKSFSSNTTKNFNDAKEAALTLSSALILDDAIPSEIRDVLSEQYNPIEDLRLYNNVNDIHGWLLRLAHNAILLLDGMITEKHSLIVSKAIKYTMLHYDAPLTSTFMATRLFISSNHFMRVFKNEMGKTYGDFLAEYRVELAKKFLKNDAYKIHDIGVKIGYPNSKYFNRIFKKYVGVSPSAYRKN